MLSTNCVTLTHLAIFGFKIVSAWKLSNQGDTLSDRKTIYFDFARGNQTWVISCPAWDFVSIPK